MRNLFRYNASLFGTIALVFLSLTGLVEAQICAQTIATQKSMGACSSNEFGYTTTIANQCPTWINIYLTDSAGFEHRQSIAPNSTNKIYDCAAPSKLTAWCYRYDSRKCDKHSTRRPILARDNKDLILESYGRIATMSQALENQGLSHPNISKYLLDAQKALDGFYLKGALNAMRNIEAEINRYYQQVSETPQLAQSGYENIPDFQYVQFTPTTNYEKLMTPFLGRWSRIRSKPRCSAITEFKSVKPKNKPNSEFNPAPKIVIAMYRDGAKILESEYQPLETQHGRLDLGKGGIVSVHRNSLLWNHGNATSEYVRCP